MKTISEFMAAVNGYFDGFKNKAVSDLVIQELRYIKPGDMDTLFRQLIISQPASWKPDLKSIYEAIKSAKIQTMGDPYKLNKCEVCGNTWDSTGICPACNYNPDTDGTPDQHKKWFEDWKAGKEPRFDVSAILAGLSVKTIKPVDDGNKKGL